MQPRWCLLPILAFRQSLEATMTTISAGAAAGLLVALMVLSTGDGFGAELPPVKAGNGFIHPGDSKGFNPQPDPPREVRAIEPRADAAAIAGDGSV
jgi:hypothetical protein